ncbi:MAG TPA: DNA mismatch repair protein MutS [Spirochaetota bacterium]|nr:DNA mismatch repair protein MutS [Spirochaetota bacterium]HOL56898.1 DNA mismatch repair protein MutS [Spirochaetota bacterium]HPP04308.1 DNA mismatch repair protein MutS [Spirochaetota bacterium]
MSNLDNNSLFTFSEDSTPMMKQYKEIKEKYPDSFLFFRCGDFYEMFGTDAIIASKILDITLTKRNDVPMCGVPYHSVDVYIAKMMKAGKKVAICEQVEDPRLAKGIVKREVQEILTPGMIIEEKLLNNKSNNFLLAINKKGLFIEIAFLDISTGDFEVQEIEYTEDLSILKGELVRISPKEIIVPENLWINDKNIRETFLEFENILVNRYPDWEFENIKKKEALFEHFNIKSFEDLGIKKYNTNLTTPAVLFVYAKENLMNNLNHIRTINFAGAEKDYMLLDETTIKNLELIKNLQDGSPVNTLLEILDDTITSMGGRLLKKYIVTPLLDIEKIKYRQSIVEYFIKNSDLIAKIEESIKKILDLERLMSRIVMNKATPKDLISIKESLKGVIEIKNSIKGIEILAKIENSIENTEDIVDLIEKAIKDEPATLTNEGNIVKDGYNKRLDELKEISIKDKEYIYNIEKNEREKYNVPSLKVKYNKIIGYFFEVSKIQSKNLPETYILKQNLVNVNRYTNKELTEFESKILTARDEINRIEEEIFNEVKEYISKRVNSILNISKTIAELDVLTAFARVSLKNKYTKPIVNDSTKIVIKEGRHPVLEQKLGINEFIPNDIEIDTNNNYLYIITGPNMSGKSTFLRQVALITLMAQIGSFVPASHCEIGIVDRIFTRIGTSDNLARGQSTFFVEMQETANILRNATSKSLIIMDEIGRGTSTFDGLALAWAILEYIYNKKFIGSKTLFATHYHELTGLNYKKGIKNLSVLVSEEGENITFLHKIIEGPAEKSYGIHVAKLANIPEEVIMYAEAILKRLEDKEEKKEKLKNFIEGKSLFDFQENLYVKDKFESEILNSIKFLNLDNITPIQALNILYDLQKKIKKRG